MFLIGMNMLIDNVNPFIGEFNQITWAEEVVRRHIRKKTYNFVRDIVIHLESKAGDNRHILPPQSDLRDESDTDNDSSDDGSDSDRN